jgi:8-oxo-dGTP diphosphatase
MDYYACAVLVCDGRILLGKRSPRRRSYPNCWDVIGGKVEEGETVADALFRELKEEVGIVPVDYVSLATIEDNNPDARGHAAYHLFVVRRWLGGEPALQDNEHSVLAWFNVDDACALADLAHPGYPIAFKNIRAIV